MKKIILMGLMAHTSLAVASIDHQIDLFGNEAVENQYIVRLQGDLSYHLKHNIEQTLDVKVIHTISQASNAVLVEKTGAQKSVLSELLVNPLVANVEPNYIISLQAVPNDTDYGRLWGLKNTGSNDPRHRPGLSDMDIRAEEAWEITTGSHDVIVAVIDTGVSANIPDLTNNMWVNEVEANGLAGVDDDNNGFVDDIHGYDFVNNDGDPTDDHGHGSHVAGTIAAEGDNGKDIVGVAWKARIMGVKFLAANGSGTSAGAIASVDYATQMGAHIMNNSWGGGGHSEELRLAIERANEKNSLFIAAAGNASNNNDTRQYYPCSYDVPNVVCVASLDADGNISDFSNYGEEQVDIAAPGRNILSTTPTGLQIFSGTSMATPHVAGAAVLLLSEFPDLTPAEVRSRMMDTSRPNYRLRSKLGSNGVLDAYSLLTNTIHPADPEDPANWPSISYLLSTPHPYPAEANLNYRVTVPNAKKFVIKFDTFETESNYDKLTFKKADGTIIAVWSGVRNGEFSPEIVGSEVILEFRSDKNVQRHGFDISTIHYQ